MSTTTLKKTLNIKEKLDEIFNVAETTLKQTVIPGDIDEPSEEEGVDDYEKTSYSIDTPEVEVVPYSKNNSTSLELIDNLFELEEKKRVSRIGVLDDDILLARKTLKELIELGRMSIGELQTLCASTEEPRIYEVFGELMKNISDVTKELIGLHKTRADILKVELESSKKDSTINNNLTQNNTLVMTTDDLMKLIKEGTNLKQITDSSGDEDEDDE